MCGDIDNLVAQVPVLRQAFAEQCDCIRAVYALAASLVCTQAEVPERYRVTLGPLPPEQLSPRRNLFSTLFLAVYQLLGVPPERRRLYGCLNQLFRVWVTSADNLLDAEDKVVLPVVLGSRSRVMREVVSIMAADRVLFSLLRQATADGTIEPAAAEALAARSLEVLLPSAAQEADEEGGIRARPTPQEVLEGVHPYKTGLLFHLPFLGPEVAERADPALIAGLKSGLLSFGLGCQVLDDVRDMARDYCERRHNLLLSEFFWDYPDRYAELARRSLHPEQRLYQEVPEVSGPAAQLGCRLLRDGLEGLRQHGLGLAPGASAAWARAVCGVLDLEDLQDAASQ